MQPKELFDAQSLTASDPVVFEEILQPLVVQPALDDATCSLPSPPASIASTDKMSKPSRPSRSSKRHRANEEAELASETVVAQAVVTASGKSQKLVRRLNSFSKTSDKCKSHAVAFHALFLFVHVSISISA